MADPQMESPKTSESGHPVQIISLDENSDLTLVDGALSQCLTLSKVGDAPICLISVIGEQRTGKSFLMSYILHRLQNQEVKDASWMGRENEPLQGFEWQSGGDTLTKGVWMWSEPLWVQRPQGKVAVFLVDTEGSMDLQCQLETSIKLSVFSNLLSSYQIFNISRRFNRNDQNFLEMFTGVAKEIGKTFNLNPIQHLDLLIRDWQDSPMYGAKGGQEHLRRIIEHLESPSDNALVLGTLKAAGTQCYVMPHPGPHFTSRSQGMVQDMTKEFKECLRDYVTTLVGSAGTHILTDQNGQILTGKELAKRIRDMSQSLKEKHYDLSSPLKMVCFFSKMREELNIQTAENTKREYGEFVLQQDRDTQLEAQCLQVEPSEMQQRLERKYHDLLQRCQRELKAEDPQKEITLGELKLELSKKMEEFRLAYSQRFRETKAKKTFEEFIVEQKRKAESRIIWLMWPPTRMQQYLEEKRDDLLSVFSKELEGEGPQILGAREKLKKDLTDTMEGFMSGHSKRYYLYLAKSVMPGVSLLYPDAE